MSEFKEPTLSTGQASELLQVHPSTVKRWLADRTDEAPTTAGGHRRIPIGQVLHLARERGHETYLSGFGADAAYVWTACDTLASGDPALVRQLMYGWLKDGRPYLIGRLLDHLASREGEPSPRLLDDAFAGFMHRVGDAWAKGHLRVGEERVASREVVETIHRILARRGGRSTPADPTRPTAVLGCMQGDHHFIGPLLVRTTLGEKGWNVEYLGPDVPIEEFVFTQQRARAVLICVSFTPPMGPSDVGRLIRVLSDFHDPARPFAVAVGGAGARGVDFAGDASPFLALVALTSLVELDRWLEEDRQREIVGEMIGGRP